jgi:hypothetical protein
MCKNCILGLVLRCVRLVLLIVMAPATRLGSKHAWHQNFLTKATAVYFCQQTEQFVLRWFGFWEVSARSQLSPEDTSLKL